MIAKNAEIMKRCAGWVLRKAGLFGLGMLSAYGFAPYYWWPLTSISIGTAYYLMKDRGYSVGFWWGAGYGLAGFHWALESIFANAEIARQLWYFYPIGLVGIAIGSGIIFGLPFYMAGKTGSATWRRVVYFALAWAFVLWLREWLLTGFPWNPVANIFIDNPVGQLMPVVGALGLTFIIAGCAAASAEYFRSREKKSLLFFLPLLSAFFLPSPPADMTEMKVRIVQPAFDMNQKFDRAAADRNIAKLVEMSEGSDADLIVWPETSYPYIMDVRAKMPALGTPLAAGSVYYEDGKIYNALLLADEKGNIVDKYFKSHLVPFGEYRPFGDIIPTPGQLSAGGGARMMGNFAPAICYEVVFSDSLLPPRGKPEFILNITNDAWFGTSSGPYQHLDMARRQALETGLPVVRANYGGISAIIDSNGRVLASLPLGERGILDSFVPAAKETTIYRQIGLNGVMLRIVFLCGLIFFFVRL
jgi:apolipoprotein N-acyltransferase